MAFDNIKLEKGLYTAGKSFTDALESIDPSENYNGTALEGLDAFERQLKRFDIKVSGANSDTISKFFTTSDAAVLFPEYVSRAVRFGANNNDKVEKIIATTTNIDSLDYRSISCNNTFDELSPKEASQGGALAECTIKLNGELTKLKKYGAMLTASYEAIKFQKLDLFAVMLKRIGENISNFEFDLAMQSISNEKSTVIELDTDLTYGDLVDLWIALNPYKATALIMSKTNASKLLMMPEFRDANAGLDFHGTGKLITPFGAEIIISNTFDDSTIVAVDKNYALERVQATDITTEFDKLIDRQIERATISKIVGFSPIYTGAVAGISLS